MKTPRDGASKWKGNPIVGYTHYWTQRRSFSKSDWAILTDALVRIARAAQERGIPLSPDNGDTPLSNHDLVSGALTPVWDDTPVFQVNGLGDMAYETFCIHRKRPELESWQSPDRRGFDFCKTDRKPYDAVVTAMLIYLENTFPKHIEVSSDGTPSDWQSGHELAHFAIQECPALQLPFSLRFNALWSKTVLFGNAYVAYESAKAANMICICKNKIVLAEFTDAAADNLRLRIEKIRSDGNDLSPPKQDLLADRRLATIARNAEILGGSVPVTQPL